MGLLGDILLLWSKLGKAEPKDTYEPEMSGQWVNKAKGFNERWVWKDFDPPYPKPVYVCVLPSRSNYKIVVSPEPIGFALEDIQCDDKRTVEIAIDSLTSYYGVLGNVSVDTGDIV